MCCLYLNLFVLLRCVHGLLSRCEWTRALGRLHDHCVAWLWLWSRVCILCYHHRKRSPLIVARTHVQFDAIVFFMLSMLTIHRLMEIVQRKTARFSVRAHPQSSHDHGGGGSNLQRLTASTPRARVTFLRAWFRGGPRTLFCTVRSDTHTNHFHTNFGCSSAPLSRCR